MIRARCEHRDYEMAVGKPNVVSHGLAFLDHQAALFRCFSGAFRHNLAQPPADDALAARRSSMAAALRFALA